MRERESERDYLQVFSWQSLNEEGRLEVWWEKIQWNSYFVPRGRKTFMSDQGVWIIVLMSEFRKKEKRKKKESESLNREEQRRVQVTWVSRQQKYSVLVRKSYTSLVYIWHENTVLVVAIIIAIDCVLYLSCFTINQIKHVMERRVKHHFVNSI